MKQHVGCWVEMPRGKNKGQASRLITQWRTANHIHAPGACGGLEVSGQWLTINTLCVRLMSHACDFSTMPQKCDIDNVLKSIR